LIEIQKLLALRGPRKKVLTPAPLPLGEEYDLIRNCNHERQQKFPHHFFPHLFLELLPGVFTLSLVAQAASSDQCVVIASLLNLRKGPGFSEEVIQILEIGQKLTILEKSEDELWLKVRLPDGKEGWVFARYVWFGDAESIHGVNLVDNLNLRAFPGMSYAVLATLTKGQPIPYSGAVSPAIG
jgi:uncharacterized protein YraI